MHFLSEKIYYKILIKLLTISFMRVHTDRVRYFQIITIQSASTLYNYIIVYTRICHVCINFIFTFSQSYYYYFVYPCSCRFYVRLYMDIYSRISLHYYKNDSEIFALI